MRARAFTGRFSTQVSRPFLLQRRLYCFAVFVALPKPFPRFSLALSPQRFERVASRREKGSTPPASSTSSTARATKTAVSLVRAARSGLRVFCFHGSSPKSMGPSDKADASLRLHAPSLSLVPQRKRGRKKGINKMCYQLSNDH